MFQVMAKAHRAAGSTTSVAKRRAKSATAVPNRKKASDVVLSTRPIVSELGVVVDALQVIRQQWAKRHLKDCQGWVNKLPISGRTFKDLETARRVLHTLDKELSKQGLSLKCTCGNPAHLTPRIHRGRIEYVFRHQDTFHGGGTVVPTLIVTTDI